MNKKLINSTTYKNICFLVITAFTILIFEKQIVSTLNAVKFVGSLKSIEYTILQLRIYVSNPYNTMYSIFNYPLIPILCGFLYNIYIFIICHKNKSFS